MARAASAIRPVATEGRDRLKHPLTRERTMRRSDPSSTITVGVKHAEMDLHAATPAPLRRACAEG